MNYFRSTQHSSLEKHSPPTTEWSPPPKMTLGQYDDEYPLRKTSTFLRLMHLLDALIWNFNLLRIKTRLDQLLSGHISVAVVGPSGR